MMSANEFRGNRKREGRNTPFIITITTTYTITCTLPITSVTRSAAMLYYPCTKQRITQLRARGGGVTRNYDHKQSLSIISYKKMKNCIPTADHHHPLSHRRVRSHSHGYQPQPAHASKATRNKQPTTN